LEITELKDVKNFMFAKITVFENKDPLKSSVHNFLVEGGKGSRRASHDGSLYLEYQSSSADNYSESRIYPKLSQELLDDPNIEIEFYNYMTIHSEMNNEFSLSIYLRDISRARDFLPSNYFKFDIDGKENTKPGFKFSELKPLAPNERFEYKDGALHLSLKSIHQPVPLKIAQYETPQEILLKNGRTVTITHISELGELIYNAQGLKSVDKSLLDVRSYENFLNRRNPKMTDALDDCLVGDKAQYRAKFLDMFKKNTVQFSM
jgi:hypothetical protein